MDSVVERVQQGLQALPIPVQSAILVEIRERVQERVELRVINMQFVWIYPDDGSCDNVSDSNAMETGAWDHIAHAIRVT